MVYETIFINKTESPISIHSDVLGEEKIYIEPSSGGAKFSLENTKTNLWCRYKKVEFIPTFKTIKPEQAQGINMPLATKIIMTWTVKLHLRRGYKSPFAQTEFITEFLNSGSPIKEWWGLANGKILMLPGVPSFVSMDIQEYHSRFMKIEILEPIIKRMMTRTPGVFRIEKKQRVSMIPRSQQELKRLKGVRDGIIKRQANIL